MKQPDVYIGAVKDYPWKPDETLDNDKAPETTPKEVVQILGFDPKELEDA